MTALLGGGELTLLDLAAAAVIAAAIVGWHARRGMLEVANPHAVIIAAHERRLYGDYEYPSCDEATP